MFYVKVTVIWVDRIYFQVGLMFVIRNSTLY